jgi:hypothetical protein
MSRKDVSIIVTKPDNPHGALILTCNKRPNSKFFNREDTIQDILDWLEEYSTDYPRMNPKHTPKIDKAWGEGSEAACAAITKGSTPLPNPYDKRWQYDEWNSWCLGNYYGMK